MHPDEVVDLFKHYISNDMKEQTLNLFQEVSSNIKYKNNFTHLKIKHRKNKTDFLFFISI